MYTSSAAGDPNSQRSGTTESYIEPSSTQTATTNNSIHTPLALSFTTPEVKALKNDTLANQEDFDHSDESRTSSPKKKKFRRYSRNDMTTMMGSTHTNTKTNHNQPSRIPFATSPTSPNFSKKLAEFSDTSQKKLNLTSPQAVNSASTRSSMAYPYSTSEDQYEESEEYDNSGEENLSSDTSSLNLTQNRFRRQRNTGPNTAQPYRRISFTTTTNKSSYNDLKSPTVQDVSTFQNTPSSDQPLVSQNSRNPSIAHSSTSLDSSTTVKMKDEPNPASPTGPSSENMNVPAVSDETNKSTVTDIAQSTPTSPNIVTNSLVTPPEQLELTKQQLPTGSNSVSASRDPRRIPLASGSSNVNGNSMTVETETVTAVPTLAVATAGGNASLKVKKSIDNVNKSLQRAKKKKSARGHGSSKAEVFAAKIASAVDEVLSSDSDETFVYDSNPIEPHIMPSASSSSMRPRFQARNPSSSSLQRLNIQPGQSQTPQPSPTQTQLISQSTQNAPPQQQQQFMLQHPPQVLTQPSPSETLPSLTISANGPDSYQTLTQTRRSNAQKQYQQQLIQQQQQQQQQLNLLPDEYSQRTTPVLHSQPSQLLQNEASYPIHPLNHQPSFQNLPNSSATTPSIASSQQQNAPLANRSYYNQNSQSSENLAAQQGESVPMRATESAPSIAKEPRTLRKKPSNMMSSSNTGSQTPTSPRHPPKSSRPGSSTLTSSTSRMGLKKQASSQLRSLSSKHFDSLNGGYKSTGQHPRRWNRHNEEDIGDDEIYHDMDEDFDDDDDDEYYEYSETTPLRQGGSGRNGQRRLRKSRGPGLRSYSPHNYQRKAQAMSRYQRIRMALWLILTILMLLAVGFSLGFLLATTKPLHSVGIADIFDVLVSDEELMFDVVVEGINPGFLSIEVSEVDLDVFARSAYVKDEIVEEGTSLSSALSASSEAGKGKDKNKSGASTMLLGNIRHFEVPLSFQGGVFSRRKQKSIGQLRLVHPGRNTTASNGGNDGDDDDDDDDNDDKDENNGGGDGPGNVPNRDFDGDDDFSFNLLAEPKTLEDGGDSDLDHGQKRWARVNLHPFDLIIRGVLRYDLILSPMTKVASISKVRFFVFVFYYF